jgi:hypothetical protein
LNAEPKLINGHNNVGGITKACEQVLPVDLHEDINSGMLAARGSSDRGGCQCFVARQAEHFDRDADSDSHCVSAAFDLLPIRVSCKLILVLCFFFP